MITIEFFLYLIKLVYIKTISFLSILKVREKGSFFYLYSFSEVNNAILEDLIKEFPDKITILYERKMKSSVQYFSSKRCKLVQLDSYAFYKQNIPAQLKQASLIVCDNYFAILGAIDFTKNTDIVQIWHANGAIKKFGLEAEHTKKSLSLNKQRYKSVYEKFTHFVVSSSKMSDVFRNSYQISVNELPFGYPKTDIYFDSMHKYEILRKGEKIKGKKKLLVYCPTYRENGLNLPFSIDHLFDGLSDEWIIYVHLHPHDINMNKILSPLNKRTGFSSWKLEDLLFITDCLVTDYSSIPFEYSLANPKGNLIFFCFDFEEYNKTTGIQEDFLETVGGNIVYDRLSLVKLIECQSNYNDLSIINDTWNEYAKGNSITQLKEWIHNRKRV